MKKKKKKGPHKVKRVWYYYPCVPTHIWSPQGPHTHIHILTHTHTVARICLPFENIFIFAYFYLTSVLRTSLQLTTKHNICLLFSAFFLNTLSNNSQCRVEKVSEPLINFSDFNQFWTIPPHKSV